MEITLTAQILSLRSAPDSPLTGGRDTRQFPSPESRWAPGERMSARIETVLPGGRFYVRVDNLLLEMHLPEGFQVGDRLELQYVGAQPRPSFLLNTLPDGTPRQDVELSASSRNLGEILKSVVPERTTGSTVAGSTPVEEPVPLLPSPTADPARLAQALSGAIGRSGLFYESHQAQWVAGQRPVADLLREPQGRLSLASQTSETVASPAGSAWMNRVAGTNGTGERDLAAIASKLAGGEESKGLNAVHPQTLPQIRSQLDALDTRQLVWQGQLWPGQELEWRIGEPGEELNGDEEPQPWFTQLRLRLPRLGELTADLAVVGSSLRVRLTSSEGSTQAAMDQGRGALAQSLSAAGIDMVSFKVAGDGND